MLIHVMCWVGFDLAVLSSAKRVELISDPRYHRFGQGVHLPIFKQITKSRFYSYKCPTTGKRSKTGLGLLYFIRPVEERQFFSSENEK